MDEPKSNILSERSKTQTTTVCDSIYMRVAMPAKRWGRNLQKFSPSLKQWENWQNGQNQLFRSLEIDHRLASIWKVFNQENWLNLGKNLRLCDSQLARVPSPHPPLHSSLEINSPPARWKQVAQQPPRETEWHWSLCRASLPENCHDLTCLEVFWKMLLPRLSLFDQTWSFPKMKSLFPRGVTENLYR